MSTTKLPEAFERKGFDDAPVQHDNSHSYVWADGYNACLEATGAKELWERNQVLEAVLRLAMATARSERHAFRSWHEQADAVLSRPIQVQPI